MADNLGTLAVIAFALTSPAWILAHPRETVENWSNVNPAAEKLAGRR